MEKFFLGMFAGIAALVGAALAADHFGYCPCSTGVSSELIKADADELIKVYDSAEAARETAESQNAESAKETTETEEA